MGLPKKREKKEKETKKKADKKKKDETTTGFKGIVRIAGKDMKGEVLLKRAVLRIAGVGATLGASVIRVLSSELSIPGTTQVGNLSDDQISKIDNVLFNLHDHNVPKFLLNRQKDKLGGKDIHAVMNDLDFVFRQDIESEKKLFTWKGYRHAFGQKVRGQRTRNTGRRGMAVGVLRKTIQAAAAAAKATDQKPGAAKEAAAPKADEPSAKKK